MVELVLDNKSVSEPHKFDGVSVVLGSFTSFKASFPLHNEELYRIIFDRNVDIVQTQKIKVAVTNLEKILKATFEMSSVSGFDRMSLRDLSRQTGMSMGAIYSCISKKEDIALMIADIVRLSSELTQEHVQQLESPWEQIDQSIRYHLYASTLLQPWYFFLYFETRSLPQDQQQESIRIELDAISSFEQKINQGICAGDFSVDNPRMVANMIVVLLEDWYLKPWKTHIIDQKEGSKLKTRDHLLLEQEQNIEKYYQSIIGVIEKMLSVSK